MSAAGESQTSLPTMVIPQGTEIRTNAQGQLSIRTPGNLIIQNSGTYGEIESTGGSIRIDANVHVEAVSLRAAQGCFVQGTLTAWKVKARRIMLDERARAYVMLQESEQLEIAKTARLVGNFANEKEVYLMLGKFSSQLRELPGAVDLQTQASLGGDDGSLTLPPFAPAAARPPAAPAAAQTAPRAADPWSAGGAAPVEPAQQQAALSEPLLQAIGILDREVARPEIDAQDRLRLELIAKRIRTGNLEEAAETYREAFAEVRSTSESLRIAFNLIDNELRYL